MALNPSSVTFNAAYPLTGGKWRVDFTSPMINGFPFQFIQDFNVQWANFTAADTGLESVTVGGVTKLAGDSSPWAINSSSPVTGFATFGTSAPAIVNSNVVFQHTEYGEEEDFGGGGPGGGGGGPIPVTTNDFVNLSVTIVAAANVGSFDVNPLVANAASTVFGAAWISGDSSFSHEIKHFTLTYNTSIIADLGLDYLRIYDESISATTTLIFDQSNWQNIGDFPYIRFGALIAGPVGVVSQDVTFSIEFFNGTIEDHVVTLSVERTGPDNVTVPDLALSAVVFEAVNVSDLALSVVVSNAPEAIAVADLALQTSVFEPVSVADLGLNANVFEPVTVADMALESHVLEGVTVAELNLSLTVYETVPAPLLALNTVVLDVVTPSINLVLRVVEPLPETINVPNLRLLSVIETPEPVTVPELKLSAIVADGVFAFSPITSFCGELS